MHLRELKKILAKRRDLDLKNIESAYLVAKKAHAGQKRKSGEDYIAHPVAVAEILCGIGADEVSIIAALLHDTVEDTALTSEDVGREFGEEVRFLVESITKISKAEFAGSKKEREVANLKKMLTGGVIDERALAIKLADRLHNMRTLAGHEKPEKRMQIAKITLDVFVPLAMQLGIWGIKQELEAICLQELYPNDYKLIAEAMKRYQKPGEKILREVARALKNADAEDIIVNIVPFERGLFSLKRKIDARDDMQIYLSDTLALRIETKTENDCYLALKIIHSLWKVQKGSEIDYISTPKANNYRAYHTSIITKKGETLMLLIATREMHEKNLRGCVFDVGGLRDRDFLKPLREIDQLPVGSPEDFIEATKSDFLAERIEVFVEGKKIVVPIVATALDAVFFAFPQKAPFVAKIKINGKNSTLASSLADGDVLHVVCDKKENAKFEWFYQIRTAAARLVLQKSLQKQGLQAKIAIGKKILQKEFDLYEKGLAENFLTKDWRKISEEYDIDGVDELFILIADGSIKPYEVFRSCFPETRDSLWQRIFKKADLFLQNFFRIHRGKERHIRLKVEGILSEKGNMVIGNITGLRNSYNIRSYNSSLTENLASKVFTLTMDCILKDRKSLHNFLGRLEQIPGVIRVNPLLSSYKQKVFIFWIVATMLIWGTFPFLLSWLRNLHLYSILEDLTIYLSLAPILVINYLLYSFIRNYFPQIRNSFWVVFIAFLLNLGGVGLFVIQMLIHNLPVDLFIIVSIYSVFSFIVIYQYIKQRIVYEEVKSERGVYAIEDVQQTRRSKIIAYSLAFVAVIIWGINPIIIRYLVADTEITISTTVAVRFFMGGGFLFIFSHLSALARGKKPTKVVHDYLFWIMVVSIFANFIFYHGAMKYTTATNAKLMENFSPIVILLIIGLLPSYVHRSIAKTKKNITKILMIVLSSSIGASLVLSHFPREYITDYKTKLFGDFVAIIAMVFFAIFLFAHNLYMKRHPQVASIDVTAHKFLAAAALFTPFLIYQRITPNFSWQEWALLSVIGFFSSGVGYTIWSKVARTLDVVVASLIFNFTVIVTIIGEHFIAGLKLDYAIIIGAVLMLFASINAERIMRIKPEEE